MSVFKCRFAALSDVLSILTTAACAANATAVGGNVSADAAYDFLNAWCSRENTVFGACGCGIGILKTFLTLQPAACKLPE